MRASSVGPTIFSLLLLFCALLGGLGSGCTEPRARITAERFRREADVKRIARAPGAMYVRAGEVEPEAPLPISECEPGQKKLCAAQVSVDPEHFLKMTCRRAPDGAWRFDRAACATPLVLAFDDEAVRFTRARGDFAVGPYARTEWVSPRTPWLALDEDGSGCVEGQAELFGPPSDGAGTNGFDKLARLDENHDGVLDARDPAFHRLIVWTDADQDRRCSAGETKRLADAGVLSLDLAYARSRPREQSSFGSHEGEVAGFSFRGAGGAARRGRLIDVYLAPID